MNDLLRELAPISADAWGEIEKEAKQALKSTLGARRVVDFSGPHGWNHSALNLGRVENVGARIQEGVQVRRRQVQPLIELRAPFTLDWHELTSVARGAEDPDLDPVREAAVNIALAEDRAVFHGYAAGGVKGIIECAGDQSLTIPDNYEDYTAVVAQALDTLRRSGINGPYGIVLGLRCYTGLNQTMTRGGGFPVIENIKRIVDGDIVYAPAVDGAVVLSQRGGDFELTVGQDFSIGYLTHSVDTVTLYLQESMTFRALSPEAAIPLRYARSQQQRRQQGRGRR
jgi:uncharacterized linocin/CFP29 family protein